MKKFAFLLAATAVVLSSSCSKTDYAPHTGDGMGIFTLSVDCVQAMTTGTKVTSYSDILDAEKIIKNVQVLIFNGQNTNSELERYLDMGTSTSLEGIRLTIGKKYIYAVVNGPDLSEITSRDQLSTKIINLAENGNGNGYIMTGGDFIEIYEGYSKLNNCTLLPRRLVSRIALVSIENSLPSDMGELKIERIFLSNVVSSTYLDDYEKPVEWINKEGRADEETRDMTHIIDGKTYFASLPDLTYREIGQTIEKGEKYEPEGGPMIFYTFPNTVGALPLVAFNSNYKGEATILVIVATLDGELQYYPLYLDKGLKRNSAYTIAVSIGGVGSSDPNRKATKAYSTVSLTGDFTWNKAGEYDEEL